MSNPSKEQQCAANTDRELWREREGDYYADSLHVTAQGAIGINCGGFVYVKPVREWFKLAGGPFPAMPDAPVTSKQRVSDSELAGEIANLERLRLNPAGLATREAYVLLALYELSNRRAARPAAQPSAAEQVNTASDANLAASTAYEWGSPIDRIAAKSSGNPESVGKWESADLHLSATYHGDHDQFWVVVSEGGKEVSRYNARGIQHIVWLPESEPRE